MRRAVVAVVVALAATPLAVARAQSKEEIARADSLFNAGKALTDAGQYADACPKFAESKRLAPGLGVTLYLADCYEQSGRTASAWSEFLSAEGLARERNDKRSELARARAQALEPKLNRLTIAVAPTIPRLGLQVLRDGSPVGQEELGLAVPVDPGDHVIVVSSPGHKVRSFNSHVGPESPTATVRVDTLDDESATAPLPATGTPTPAPAPLPTSTSASTLPSTPVLPPTRASDDGAARRWIGLSMGGIGVVGVGVGAALGLVAKSKLDQSNSGPCDPTDRCSDSGLALRKDAGAFAMGSTIAFVAGGIALATGVVLYVTAPHSVSTTGVLIVPAPIVGGGGASVRVGF
jgi:hypothetical protein